MYNATQKVISLSGGREIIIETPQFVDDDLDNF